MTASGWFRSVRIFIFHSLSLVCREKEKNSASEPKVRFTCWGQMSSWSQFPGFMVRSWERLSWCYCKLSELDWSGLILLFSNLSLLCFIATMYHGFFRSLHALLWHSQWLAFDPVSDWVICLLLAWFYLPVLFGGAPIVSFSLRFSWRFDLWPWRHIVH